MSSLVARSPSVVRRLNNSTMSPYSTPYKWDVLLIWHRIATEARPEKINKHDSRCLEPEYVRRTPRRTPYSIPLYAIFGFNGCQLKLLAIASMYSDELRILVSKSIPSDIGCILPSRSLILLYSVLKAPQQTNSKFCNAFPFYGKTHADRSGHRPVYPEQFIGWLHQ